MSFVTSTVTCRAAKAHRCWYCAQDISIGEIYSKRCGAQYGDFWTMRMHPECDEWASANWGPEDYEGFSQGDEFARPMTAFDPAI